MRQDDERLLMNALQALRSQEPDEAQISAAAGRVAGRIGMDSVTELNAVEPCDDVRYLLDSYRAGALSSARAERIEAHLQGCAACLRLSQKRSAAAVDWSTPKASSTVLWRPRKLGWGFGMALACTCAVAACSLFLYRAYWQVPPGVRAEVESIDGSAWRISAGKDGKLNGQLDGQLDHQLAQGDKLAEGEELRTSGGAHAVLRLSDGSSVEVNERSALRVGARGHDMTLALDNGDVIVQAAKRESGHLYVKTPDCRVAVTGTVFSVNSGIKGSRVAVLEGSVEMVHGGVESTIHAGDQRTTNDNQTPTPVEAQIAWSHDLGKYLPLLAQFSALQAKLALIPSPQLRYTSDLLSRVPSDTMLYVSIPNLGDFLSQANKIFDEQLKQSPALQQWWSEGRNHNTADLDALVDKIHQASQYLGDEVVVVGYKESEKASFAVVADVTKSGFADFLKTQLPSQAAKGGLIVLNEAALKALPASAKTDSVGYALVREHEAVFSNNVATLRKMDTQLNAGASGFATADFGQQVAAAYGRGAGVILAANLHPMLGDNLNLALSTKKSEAAAIENSGIADVQYLIAEHREVNGLPENHLNLQFSGTRQRVASWLAAPAPIGSLDFVTPNASVAIALLSKDPKAIADDILAMTDSGEKGEDAMQASLKASFRDDLAANFGGDFLVSLDGPVLPTPSWKAVAEVHDSAKLESTLEQLSQLSQSIHVKDKANNFKGIAIDASQVDSQRYYSVRNVASGAVFAQYTFADGYMVLAPSRALLIEALRAHTSGDSLAHSAAFKALLPKDANDNYSAVAYQNLSPVLGPLLSQFGGEQADAIRKLAADSRPTAICAWGRDSRIEAASNSQLLGFDFLTLGSLIGHGNNATGESVQE